MNDILSQLSFSRSFKRSAGAGNFKDLSVSGHNFVELEKVNENASYSGSAGKYAQGRPGFDMTRFNAAVASITHDIEAGREILARLRDLHEESKIAVKPADMHALRSQMNGKLTVVSVYAKKVKDGVEALNADNEANRKYAGCGARSATDRSRTAVTYALGKKLRDLMSEFQVLQSRMAAEHKQEVERRVYTVTGQQPDAADVERIIETGQSDVLLKMAVERGRGAGGALQMDDILADIQERHTVARALETSVRDLAAMFLDMATLVEAQGELLNVVEDQIGDAYVDVEKGNLNLKRAKAHQSSTRRWMCICSILLLLIVLVLSLSVYVAVK
eukprot:jgi/Mesen1/9412/ME000614S08670